MFHITVSPFLFLVFFTLAVRAGEIEVINNCGQRIFVKNEGGDTGGFHLQHQESRKFGLYQDARARVWAHRGCDDGGNNCDTTEGYASLAEMHWDDTFGMIGFTWYDISQVDGYNLPITMEPFNPNAGGRCEKVGCNFSLDDCPDDSRVYKDGRLVGCINRNRDAITEYSQRVKNACPNTYTWSQDDLAGMRDCQPGNPGIRVIFC